MVCHNLCNIDGRASTWPYISLTSGGDSQPPPNYQKKKKNYPHIAHKLYFPSFFLSLAGPLITTCWLLRPAMTLTVTSVAIEAKASIYLPLESDIYRWMAMMAKIHAPPEPRTSLKPVNISINIETLSTNVMNSPEPGCYLVYVPKFKVQCAPNNPRGSSFLTFLGISRRWPTAFMCQECTLLRHSFGTKVLLSFLEGSLQHDCNPGD